MERSLEANGLSEDFKKYVTHVQFLDAETLVASSGGSFLLKPILDRHRDPTAKPQPQNPKPKAPP